MFKLTFFKQSKFNTFAYTSLKHNQLIPTNSIYNFNLKNFVVKRSPQKDYYNILEIKKNATEEEIKKAYRNLAKRYHPDVNSLASDTHEPSAAKFRDVAEAYAVLSNRSMKLDYDMRMKNFPDSVYNSEKMKNMEESQKKRNNEGNVIKPAPLKGSYADHRLETLKEWRKKFNVDENGLYKGGGNIITKYL